MADTPITMPKLGLTMSEGLLAEWLVAPGDEVRAGQVLFVVETDKISSEVEAPTGGRITALLAAVGDTVAVGAPVATWTGGGDEVPPAATEPALTGLAAIGPAVAAALPDRCRSTPLARRLARLGGIEIAAVAGTGPRDRVQAADVRAVIAHAAPAVPVATPPSARPPGAERDLRPLIAARVSRSNAEVPHFYLTADAAVDALVAMRRDLNDDSGAPRKLSLTACLGAAVARALALDLAVNLVWRGDRVERLPGIAIGFAVETPGGVVAPVVAAGHGLYPLAEALDAAIDRARRGRLGPRDGGAAAIGISNVGMFGVRALLPVVDPEQSFMLGIGAPRGVFRPGPDGSPRAVQEMTLSLACDHRAIDGAAAARFLAAIVALIEHPARLLLPVRPA